MSEEFSCFFVGREDAGLCRGTLVRAHLIKRQVLAREFPYGCVYEGDWWWPLKRGEDRHDLPFRSLEDLVNDERSWVPMCGGIMGNAGHHGMASPDGFALPIYYEQLPEGFIEFLSELGMLWYAERTYDRMHA